MKKPFVLAAVLAGVAAVLQRRKSAQADEALWREATDSVPR